MNARTRAAILTPTAEGVLIHTPADGATYRADLTALEPMIRADKAHHLRNGRVCFDWMRPADLDATAHPEP